MKSLHQSNYLFLFIGQISMCLLLGTSLVHFEQIGQKNSHLREHDWNKAQAAHNLDAQIRKTGIMLMEMLIASESLQTEAILPRMQRAETGMRQNLAALENIPASANQSQERNLLDAINTANSRYTTSYEHARQLIRQGRKDDATRLINYETLPLLDAVQEPLLSLIELQQRKLDQARLDIHANTEAARNHLFLLSGIAVLATLLAAFMVAHQRRVSDDARSDGAGRPDGGDGASSQAPERAWRTAPPAFAREQKQVLEHFTLERQRVPAQPRRAASSPDVIDIVASVQRENGPSPVLTLCEGKTDRPRPPSHEKIQEKIQEKIVPHNEPVKKNLAPPPTSAAPAPSATLASQKSDRLVTQVVDTMGLIKAHSNQIVAFINVMDGIAADTARLAQNAEAAASGLPGHDLTLVAAEVQALAQRANTVASEIRLLSEAPSTRVEAGLERVDQAGETINDIVASVKRVSGMIRQISQQSPGAASEALNQASARIEAAVCQNSRLVGHMAATAHGMQQKIEQVAHAVSLYKLGTLGTRDKGRRPGHAVIIDLALMRKRADARHRQQRTVRE